MVVSYSSIAFDGALGSHSVIELSEIIMCFRILGSELDGFLELKLGVSVHIA